jgi:hypothetical protein
LFPTHPPYRSDTSISFFRGWGGKKGGAINQGCLRGGDSPLFLKINSPSPSMERGIKGVRLVKFGKVSQLTAVGVWG